MLGLVENLVWYGYLSAADIALRIDQDAAAGDGFDLACVRAFAAATLHKKRLAEATWPAETDVDRLDRAFARLEAQRVCALACAGDTVDDGYEAVSGVINADGVPDDRYMGYCFFHSQDVDRALAGGGLLLAFGYLDSDVKADAIPVGRLIVEALQQEGLQTRWSGSATQRIAVPGMHWQRRTPAA